VGVGTQKTQFSVFFDLKPGACKNYTPYGHRLGIWGFQILGVVELAEDRFANYRKNYTPYGRRQVKGAHSARFKCCTLSAGMQRHVQ